MVRVVDASSERWDDVAVVMGTRGDPSRCWCQWFRLRHRDFAAAPVDELRDALHTQVDAAIPPGVLAYDDAGAPSGWCAVAPRAVYPRLAKYGTDGAWAVTCFVVRVGARRQGLATPLLDGAIDLARRHGADAVEAYPVDTAVHKPSSAELYHGALSVFLRAGFREVGERSTPARPVVRLEL
jgi:GNAT superfamily N-acetyltransferase